MKRDLVVLTTCAIAAFLVLVALGTWQLQRLAWKDGLIARIESRTTDEPISLKEALSRWKNTGGDVEYLRVRLNGRFLHDLERHLFNVVKGESGWQVMTPFETEEGAIVIVDRGFVLMTLKSVASRPEGQVSGTNSLVGLVRLPETKAYFTPENSPDKNEWYWRDIGGMANSVLSPSQRTNLVPFFVALEANDIPGGWPRAGTTRLELPNKHLQYAFTWFALAGTLVFVYVLFVWKRRRSATFT